MRTHAPRDYVQAWLVFGIPSAVIAALLLDVVAPAALGWAPAHEGLQDTGIFVIVLSATNALLWPWLSPNTDPEEANPEANAAASDRGRSEDRRSTG